jgi:3-keto-5-aminohexanoate cleavage enzyme
MQDTKYVLNFTPTGMMPTREMTPHVPLKPEEIIQDVLKAAELGINMVHLHARDPETGMPTYRKEIFQEIIQGIRKNNPDLIICVSTSGRFYTEFEKRSECLEINGALKPDFASLTLSSLNFNKEASLNSPSMIQNLVQKMTARGIRPELEAFDLGMINYAKYLIQKGLLKPPYYFNLIVGNIACAQATLLHLGLMINELPEGSLWSVGGVGDFQFAANSLALAAGGGVRVGLEDTIWFDAERTRLATNLELVERIVNVGKALGRHPYTPKELRMRLNLSKTHKVKMFSLNE